MSNVMVRAAEIVSLMHKIQSTFEEVGLDKNECEIAMRAFVFMVEELKRGKDRQSVSETLADFIVEELKR